MVTTTTELIDSGEKRDRRGRRISSVERRAEAVREWRASGLTMAAFARREGIGYQYETSYVVMVTVTTQAASGPETARTDRPGWAWPAGGCAVSVASSAPLTRS